MCRSRAHNDAVSEPPAKSSRLGGGDSGGGSPPPAGGGRVVAVGTKWDSFLFQRCDATFTHFFLFFFLRFVLFSKSIIFTPKGENNQVQKWEHEWIINYWALYIFVWDS